MLKNSTLTTVFLQLNSLRFAAHDFAESELAHSLVDGWTIRNNRGLYLTYGDNFIRAMGDFYCVTGVEPKDMGAIADVYV